MGRPRAEWIEVPVPAVKEVLVGGNTITLRHSIPIPQSGPGSSGSSVPSSGVTGSRPNPGYPCIRGVLSTLLANIYLDALDQELEKRGHRFCRYADDCNIYVGSQSAAERTLASVHCWIEKHLRLKGMPVRAERGGSGNVSSWGFDWVARSGSE